MFFPDDKLDSVHDYGSKAQSAIATLTPAMQEAIASSPAAHNFETTADDFFYGIPEVIDALGIIAKIHPFLDGKIQSLRKELYG